MSNYQSNLDPESDELIRIMVDTKRASVERTRATQQLYHRHTSWVIQQIGKKTVSYTHLTLPTTPYV